MTKKHPRPLWTAASATPRRCKDYLRPQDDATSDEPPEHYDHLEKLHPERFKAACKIRILANATFEQAWNHLAVHEDATVESAVEFFNKGYRDK